MNKVIVYKNTLGDTRTADRMPAKEEFNHSNWLHKDDVMTLAHEFADELQCRCGNHDWTKVQEPYASKFYNLMKATIEDGADFDSGEWAHLHYDVLERHHLKKHCPDDVDLFDVLEMIFDSVSAGMARSGSVYPLEISNEILQKAVANTVNYLVENIEIVEENEEEQLWEDGDIPCNTCEYYHTAEEALPCYECMYAKVSKYRRAEQ